MLVITRARSHSVIIGDEVSVTVEDIVDELSGEHVPRSNVRLGFEAPRWLTICRSELAKLGNSRDKLGRTSHRAPLAGKVCYIDGLQVKLRIEAPAQVPVHHNGALLAPDSIAAASKELPSRAPTAVYRVACREGDRIAICHNIVITPVAISCFVLAKASLPSV